MELTKPKCVAGVGDAAKPCTHQAVVPEVLENGSVINYAAPVIGGGPSAVPPLYGLDSMAKENNFLGTRNGQLAMVPDGMSQKQICRLCVPVSLLRVLGPSSLGPTFYEWLDGPSTRQHIVGNVWSQSVSIISNTSWARS